MTELDPSKPRLVAGVMLVITGDDLLPEVVTRSLGMFADAAWRRGEHGYAVSVKDRKIIFPDPAEHGVWKKAVPDEQQRLPLQEQLQWWVDTLEPRLTNVRELAARGWQLELNCFIGGEGDVIHLEPHILQSLATLGVRVALEIMPA